MEEKEKTLILRNEMEIKKSEQIIYSRYRLSSLALKFINAVIGAIRKDDHVEQKYVVRVKDFQELAGLGRTRVYEYVKEAIEELLKSPITVPLGDGNYLKANWISSAVYKNGTIFFSVDPQLRPFLLDFKEKFLKYRIENILSLKSSYSIRLYELFKNWHFQDERERTTVEHVISVDKLREILLIPDSYQYSSHIKKQILRRAQEEFKKHTDLSFDFEEIKKGRAIVKLRFFIMVKGIEETNWKNDIRKFVIYIREKYGSQEKSFGWIIDKETRRRWWLFIDEEGLVYGMNRKGEKRFFSSNDSFSIYKKWFQILEGSEEYRKAVENVEDLRNISGYRLEIIEEDMVEIFRQKY